MHIEKKIEVFSALGNRLLSYDIDLQNAYKVAYHHNRWFTVENIKKSVEAIAKEFLNKEKLTNWVKKYPQSSEKPTKNVGLVLAGNLPLVGFHDFLAVVMSNHKAVIKLSSKDEKLFQLIFQILKEIDPEICAYFEVVERLKNIDAVIATGSNNSARYFEHYFGKYPHIIRKNRSSVAILRGDETEEDLKKLGNDVFDYFGLGCRNVSKILVPKGFDLKRILAAWDSFEQVMDYSKYKNNFDYNRTLLLMNYTPHFANDFVSLVENTNTVSPVSIVYYEFYENEDEVSNYLIENRHQIQCVVGKDENYLDYGTAQQPTLTDYADHIDTMEFLKGI